MIDEQFENTFSYTLIYVFAIHDEPHRGCLKIGMTSYKPETADIAEYASLLNPGSSLLNKAARLRIDTYTKTAGIKYELLYTELAERRATKDKRITLEYFSDHQVHLVLKNSGIEQVRFHDSGANEWFRTDIATVKNAIKAVKENRQSLSTSEVSFGHIPITFRPEQNEAIDMTIDRFKRGNKVLWNAKMRFGKTLCTLEVINRKEFKKTLILTHRPVVDEGWHDDFYKITWKNEYQYLQKGTEETTVSEHILKGDSFILFASIQDLRGSHKVGGKYDKNDLLFQTEWDCVVIDEAHEGTKTSLGDDVLKEIIKEESYGKTKQIYLSGTPFNLVDDFSEDEVYTWDYVMEQKAKSEWDIINGLDSNPYESLPKLSIYTYDIADAIPGYMDLEDKAFNFREFFRVWTGIVQNDGRLIPEGSAIGRFVHEQDVESFIHLLRLKDEDSNYPFSRDEYREYFRHTLWMMPGVKEASAMEGLLKRDEVFKHFNIVNVAGDTLSGENADALQRLHAAISDRPEETWTITLSCGRLTTGVTVKPWTAVLMLSGSTSTSASMYLQTIFRVQSPANIGGKMKDRCFVFDFAPDRTLQMVAEAGKLGTRPGRIADEDKMKDFLKFCPVIAIKGSAMRSYDVDSMLRQLKRYYAARVVQNGFDDVKLYNDKLLQLTDLDRKKFEDLQDIVGSSNASAIKKTIVISESGLGAEEQEAAEAAEKKKKKREELTAEEKEALRRLKEAKEAKSKAISILRAISIRIPLLVYGAEKEIDEDITIDQFADLVDGESWKEFMPKGVTKEEFNDFIEYYDKDIFVEAGNQIRRKVKAADELHPTERVKKLASLFATFKNPDKETVLTPWRVVNMHLGECLGGYSFFDEEFSDGIEEPRFIDQGEVTRKTLANTHSKILEINSKSGLYPLYVTYSLYRKRLDIIPDTLRTEELQHEIWQQTIKENTFVICKTEMAKYITKRTLLGYRSGEINAHYFKDLINQFKNKPEKVVKKIKSADYWNRQGDEMKFDAIVGNPPYQVMNKGDGKGSNPVYHLFYDASQFISDRVTFIHPARFLFNAGKTPKEWNDKMLNDSHFKVVSYWPDSISVFTTVDIKGGVAITLWDKESDFGKIGAFSPYEEMKTIIQKVLKSEFIPFSEHVYPRDLYRLSNQFYIENDWAVGRPKKGHKYDVGTNIFDLFPELFFADKPDDGEKYALILGREDSTRREFWIKEKFIKVPDNYRSYKVIITKANGSGSFGEALSTPIVGNPGVGHTVTFLSIGKFQEEFEATSVLNYIKTKFARALLGTLKVTQDNPRETWQNVPNQNFGRFSDIDWTRTISEIDRQLYEKYNLSEKEITFIEAMISSME